MNFDVSTSLLHTVSSVWWRAGEWRWRRPS